MNRRDAVKSGLTVIVGGKPGPSLPPPTSTYCGALMIFRPEGGIQGSGEVQVTPRRDGSYLVRPVRSAESTGWKDH